MVTLQMCHLHVCVCVLTYAQGLLYSSFLLVFMCAVHHSFVNDNRHTNQSPLLSSRLHCYTNTHCPLVEENTHHKRDKLLCSSQEVTGEHIFSWYKLWVSLIIYATPEACVYLPVVCVFMDRDVSFLILLYTAVLLHCSFKSNLNDW